MRITKTETPDFALYAVYETVETREQNRFLGFPNSSYHISTSEILVQNVLDADAISGMVSQQVVDRNGDYVYTDGTDDVALNDTNKLLLKTVSAIREAFFAAGFVPKITTRMAVNLRICKREK